MSLTHNQIKFFRHGVDEWPDIVWENGFPASLFFIMGSLLISIFIGWALLGIAIPFIGWAWVGWGLLTSPQFQLGEAKNNVWQDYLSLDKEARAQIPLTFKEIRDMPDKKVSELASQMRILVEAEKERKRVEEDLRSQPGHAMVMEAIESRIAQEKSVTRGIRELT